jgi:hypothetical protein
MHVCVHVNALLMRMHACAAGCVASVDECMDGWMPTHVDAGHGRMHGMDGWNGVGHLMAHLGSF